jgi:hypothetical protein
MAVCCFYRKKAEGGVHFAVFGHRVSVSGFYAVHFEVLCLWRCGHPKFFVVFLVFRKRELADFVVVPVRDHVVGG